jgi:sulfur carrier protein
VIDATDGLETEIDSSLRGSEIRTVRDASSVRRVAPAEGSAALPYVSINGSVRPIDPATTIASLIEEWCESPDGVAVARNGEVVPRSEWHDTSLESGDRVEILTAAAGG